MALGSTIAAIFKSAFFAALAGAFFAAIYGVSLYLMTGLDAPLSDPVQAQSLYLMFIVSLSGGFFIAFLFAVLLSPIGVLGYWTLKRIGRATRSAALAAGGALGIAALFLQPEMEVLPQDIPPGLVVQRIIMTVLFMLTGMVGGYAFWRHHNPKARPAGAEAPPKAETR